MEIVSLILIASFDSVCTVNAFFLKNVLCLQTVLKLSESLKFIGVVYCDAKRQLQPYLLYISQLCTNRTCTNGNAKTNTFSYFDFV